MPKKSHYGIPAPRQQTHVTRARSINCSKIPADIEEEIRLRQQHAKVRDLRDPKIKC